MKPRKKQVCTKGKPSARAAEHDNVVDFKHIEVKGGTVTTSVLLRCLNCEREWKHDVSGAGLQ